MGYQISEQTRLRQITAEIFVREGFDGAINLDQESYNFSHPHYQYLLKWLHSALRQLTNRHKRLGKELRSGRITKEGKATRAELGDKVTQMLNARDEDVPQVVLLQTDETERAGKLRREGIVALRRSEVIPPTTGQRRTPAEEERREQLAESRAIAVAQILESWGLMKELTYSDEEKLVREIVEVVLFGRGE